MSHSPAVKHPRAVELNQLAQTERWPYTRVLDWLQRPATSADDLAPLDPAQFSDEGAPATFNFSTRAGEWRESEETITVSQNQHSQIAHLCQGEGVLDTRLHFQLEDGARLDLVRLSQLSGPATSFEKLRFSLGEKAVVHIHDFNLEQGLSHVQLQADLNGAGAEIHLSSLSLLAGRSRAVLQVDVNHNAVAAISRLEFRNAVADRARRSVIGMVRVTPEGQHTDSAQICRSLLLSPKAAADMRPELEIYADQVACAHGATCGELDETALHYLRSRGLNLLTARRLLLESFALPLLSNLPSSFADELERSCTNALQRLGERLQGKVPNPKA